MALIISGFSPGISLISCPWECRFPDVPNVDGTRSLPRVLLPTDGPDPVGISQLALPGSYDLENPEFPMADVPTI